MTNSTVPLKRTKYARGMNPNSRKNLVPFPKGTNGDHSHNGYTITSTLKDLIHKESEFIAPHARPTDKLWREQIAREILVKAVQGDVPMVKELLDRTEGKVPGDSPPPVNVNVVFVIGKGYRDVPQLVEGKDV